MIFSLAACSENKDVKMMDDDGFGAGVDSDIHDAACNSSAADDSDVDAVARVENGMQNHPSSVGWIEITFFDEYSQGNNIF